MPVIWVSAYAAEVVSGVRSVGNLRPNEGAFCCWEGDDFLGLIFLNCVFVVDIYIYHNLAILCNIFL